MELIVNEIFVSFQGEGINTGIPTIFIRLAGCNLRCAWCDTEYALGSTTGKPLGIGSILENVRWMKLDRICLTGGEPLLQEGVWQLLDALVSDGKYVDVETNGTQDIRPCISLGDHVMVSMDVKTPSSGMEGKTCWSNLFALRPSDQLKFIVRDEADIVYAAEVLRKHSPASTIIFTSVSNENIGTIADLVMQKVISGELPSRVRFMVQMHKIIWGADRRGV